MKLKPLHFLTLDRMVRRPLSYGGGNTTLESPYIFLGVSPIYMVLDQTLGKPFKALFVSKQTVISAKLIAS